MWLRLRQIALIAQELAPVEVLLTDVLDIEVCYRDPGVGYFGLENALLPIGNQLLEVVAPIQEQTAGGRYLERRGGDGGYMVITQCDDHEPRRARVAELGIRLVLDNDSDEYRNMQLHPKDTGGSFFEIDQQLGEGALERDGPWHPAGPNWQRAKKETRVRGISAAEIQCDDPTAVSARWSEIAEIPLDGLTLPFENAEVRFVPIDDGRPEGLSAIDLLTTDKTAVIEAGEAHGVYRGEDRLEICGIRMNLI